ncbi:hypothetical protein LV84_02180 [Algoriphagus ratkowskyi]|uniref:Uncharacterized protein n=1 Tax=Algoriphagus ratkowskyi TaxID=57028 RepID=A0A2W7RR98_9BACT|nr:hypothetical protein [Algoriphagus ratkowskyi]PZX57049.1 hypothetical protein LV84_02180 [Algoriphagus ratkowskyi]TXD79946.1 hypothetical protein ESW18_02115 [Algoriphagus ratkowskyi]
MELFQDELRKSSLVYQLDADLYLNSFLETGIIAKSHPGATAHLNRVKSDCLYSLAYDGNILPAEKVAMDTNKDLKNAPITKNGTKDYIYAAKEFAREL